MSLTSSPLYPCAGLYEHDGRSYEVTVHGELPTRYRIEPVRDTIKRGRGQATLYPGKQVLVPKTTVTVTRQGA